MSGGGLTLGKAYRVQPGSPIVGLLLPCRGEARLILWYEGRLISFPSDKATAVREEPDVLTLCASWGIELSTLDRYARLNLYEGHPDVVKVRADERRRVGGSKQMAATAHNYFGPE